MKSYTDSLPKFTADLSLLFMSKEYNTTYYLLGDNTITLAQDHPEDCRCGDCVNGLKECTYWDPESRRCLSSGWQKCGITAADCQKYKYSCCDPPRRDNPCCNQYFGCLAGL